LQTWLKLIIINNYSYLALIGLNFEIFKDIVSTQSYTCYIKERDG